MEQIHFVQAFVWRSDVERKLHFDRKNSHAVLFKRTLCSFWIKQEHAEDVIVPNVSRFGETNKVTEEQGCEDVKPGSALQGLLLPQPLGENYRLLKVVTQPATAEQIQKLGNDRAPVLVKPK